MFLYDVPNVVLTYIPTLPLLLRAIKFYGSSAGIYILCYDSGYGRVRA